MPNGRLMEEAGIQAVIKGLAQFKAGAKEMDEAIAGVGRSADKTKAPVSRLQKSFADLEAKASKAIIPLTVISAALVAVVGKMTMTAARTQELGVVVENMGRVAGYSEEQLSLVEKEIKDLGITTQSARTIMTRFIGAELDLADASKIARAAQDLAVIGMEDSSTAASNLTYAIASMQPRILRQYGLFINLNKVYEETATTLGKTVEELTETEKRQGFLNAVLSQAASYAGTYDAAMGTAGKQLRSFSRYTEEISNQLGEFFLPYLAEGVGLATQFAKSILAVTDKTKAYEEMAKKLSKTVDELTYAEKRLATARADVIPRVLLYATAISVVATAMAGLVLVMGKLKAALVFMINPWVLAAAAIAFLVVRAIEWRMELRKLEDELLETTKTSKEYVAKLAEIKFGSEKAAEATDQFRRDGGAATIMLREQRKAIEEVNDGLRWLINYYEESGWAAAEMGEQASRALGLTGEYIAKADAASEAALEGIRVMGRAFYGNVTAIQDNITAYDELENKVVTVFANTAATTRNFQKATQRAEEDAALRREDLLEKHAEKMHWVATGAHARTKKENEEAFAHWSAINAEELAEFDAAVALKQTRRTEDYDHQIATANAAAAERSRIAEEQRQAELEAQRRAQEERLALLALEMIAAHQTLTLMSPWGELEVSAQEYYDAISSGIVPVSEAMKKNLGEAIGFIDDQMTTANKNVSEGYKGWEGIIEGIVPDVMELGTITEEEAENMTRAMEQRLNPAVVGLTEGIDHSNERFGVWAVDSGVATDEIGQSLEALEEPMKFVQEKIGETEVYYGEQMTAMQTKTNDTFEEIETTIDQTLTGVQTAFATTLTQVHRKLLTFKPKFRKAGRDLVEGLIKGILDKQKPANRAMRRLVLRMIEAAEAAAGSHSPSTVFMAIGRDMILGLIEGLRQIEPALAEAIVRLSEGMSEAWVVASEKVGGFVSLLSNIVSLFDKVSGLDMFTETIYGFTWHKDRFVRMMTEMANALREVWEATKDWIGEMTVEGLDALDRYVTILRNMVAYYSDLLKLMTEINTLNWPYPGWPGPPPFPTTLPSAAAPMAAAPVMVQGGQTFNYNLSANYSQVQSPASIMDDLEAMEMLTGARG